MTDNTNRFTGRAEDYDRYRQRYPTAEILGYLRRWCELEPTHLVADIGAGTGMLAEVFLENGNRTFAIEPNADMREQMHATFDRLGNCWPALEIIDATAEATTLPDASIDIVAAGRAFHWFNKDLALPEFRRILKPTGWIALISLGRAHDASDATLAQQTRTFDQLLIEHGTDYKYIRSGYRVFENMTDIFGPDAELHQVQLPGTQQLDWTSFRGQTMSLSIVPQEDHPNYETFQRELRLYFDTHAIDGILTEPTTCWITVARFSVDASNGIEGTVPTP